MNGRYNISSRKTNISSAKSLRQLKDISMLTLRGESLEYEALELEIFFTLKLPRICEKTRCRIFGSNRREI